MADVWHALPPRPPSYRAYAFSASVIVCMTLILQQPRHYVVHAPNWHASGPCSTDALPRGVEKHLLRAMHKRCVHTDIVVAGEFEVDGSSQPYCLALLCTSGRLLRNTFVTLRSRSSVQCKLTTGNVQTFPCPVHLNTGEIIKDRTMCCIVNVAMHMLGL